MISGLTEQQFGSLPPVSLQYACDQCGKTRDYGYLKRSLDDYSVVDGKLLRKETYTALYVCNGCGWKIQCEYQDFDKYQDDTNKQQEQ